MKYVIPAGGDDLAKIQGGIKLTLADENTPPAMLIGKDTPESIEIDEVIYADNEGVMCRR